MFQEFNLSLARDSVRNVSTKIPWRLASRLLIHHCRLGIREKTLVDVVRQLYDEKIKPWQRTRRRTYQAVLGFDIFREALRTMEPDFATFFTNHAAATLHRYWAAASPRDY